MTLTRFFSALVVAMLCLTAIGTSTKAGTLTFNAVLSGANEVPPKQTNGSGTATLIIDDVTGKATITVSFSGLTSAVTGGHVHCCAAPGANGPIILPFDSFLTLGTGGTSGSLSNFTFSTTLTAQQISDIKNGLAYVNIHTSNNPGGEIRGQLTAAAVPEPTTLLLLGSGLLSLAGRKLRKRKKEV